MKKTIKRTTAAILAVATTAGIAGATSLSPTRTSGENTNRVITYAEGAQADSNTLQISKYEKTINLYDYFEMPTAYFKGLSGTSVQINTYTITTPTGATLTEADVNDNKFKVDEIGTYTISYKDASGKYQGQVTFDVQMSSYEIEIESNKNVLPSKLGIKNAQGTAYTGEFNIPSVKVTDENGKVIDSDDYILEVSLTNPSYDTKTITDGKIKFDADYPIEVGYYIVTYSVYEKKSNETKGALWGETTTEFNAVSDYDNEFDLTLKFDGTKPETVNVGKTVELPSISAKNDTENVPVSYTVEVYKGGSTTAIKEDTTKVGNTDTYILTKNENGVYEFTADEVGVYYRFVYKATDALGNEATKELSIDNASVDTIKPTPLVVDHYDPTDAEALKALKNEDYKLKSVFADGEDVVIKAIYAEDLATFDYNDYTFERIIENENRREIYKVTERADACKDIVFDQSGASLTSDDTRVVATQTSDGNTTNLKLDNGTYYAYYRVTDKNGNTKEESYTFIVKSTFDWTENEGTTKIVPTITFNDTFYSSVDLGETIEFGEITVKDDYDTRPEYRLYYKYTIGGSLEATERELTLNDDGKYAIDTKDAPTGATAVTIYAEAKNDGFSMTNEKATKEQTILLKSQKLGTATPTIYEVQDSDYDYEYTQGAKITLPTLIFQDGVDGVGSLKADITIKCTTLDDKVIEYKAQNAVALKVGEGANGYLYYSNATFRASTAGNYQVAVKVTDAQGNVIIKFLNYTVETTSASGELKFENLSIEDTTIELGETLKLPAATITGEDSDDYDYDIICVKGPVKNVIQERSEFIPDEVGEYKLQYIMYEKDDPTNTKEKYEFTVTVKDTKGPQIHVDWQTERLNDSTVKQSIKPAYDLGVKILIPKFSASDISKIDTENSKITISTTNHTYTIKYSEMNEEYANGLAGTLNKMFIECKDNGEYTITYTAYDLEGNKSTLVKTIKVGDLIPPTLTVKDNIVSSTYKAGETISIDLADSAEYITVSDNKTTLSKTDIKVTLYDPSGKEVKKTNEDSNIYKFKLTDAGEYELKFQVTDKAGLTTEVVKKFTIASEEKSNMTTNEILGTVLIVVSVAVLAGVVVYFIVSKRKMDKLYKG